MVSKRKGNGGTKKIPAGHPTSRAALRGTGKGGQARFIVVTGGVCSSLGKGITVSSIGAIMKACGFKVFVQKLDPYLNVDPGTLSPFQHGEVYVRMMAPRRTSTLATTSGSLMSR